MKESRPFDGIPNWYDVTLKKIAPFLTEEEHFEMRYDFPEFFAEKIRDAKIDIREIGKRTGVFVDWLRRKVLWSKDHNGLFFRRMSAGI